MAVKWNPAVPRYTSYPTAPQFQALEEDVLKEKLSAFDKTEKPLSVYIHIPFCKSMCLFCGCSVILNRNPVRQTDYLNDLLNEIRMTAASFEKKRVVTQLHLGGGTPTSLTEEEFALLMSALKEFFIFADDGEISIEIDPRTVHADGGKKLEVLKSLGFNRVSFGVQDLDQKVQEAVKRRQSEEMSVETLAMAKKLGFSGINLDLIYGLPLQTVASFQKTADRIAEVRPDRISFFSYAKVPWLKAHQKAIREEDLPSTEEKLEIYKRAQETFLAAGYVQIGMDHFALPSDSIALAYAQGKLMRNFQGYSVEKAEDLLGFGVTSIGYLEGAFFQNVKTLEEYKGRISTGRFPMMRGFVLNQEDLIRRWVIQEIMCRFEIDPLKFQCVYHKRFEEHFAKEMQKIESLIEEGLLEKRDSKWIATKEGRLFIRLIASAFDAYFTEEGRFSKVV